MADFIKKAVEVGFDKRVKPSMLLSNLFKTKMLNGIKVEVQGRVVKSLYSVDVQLGTGGRRVDLSSFDKKDFTVPEYNNYAVINEEDMFKAQLGETEYTAQVANIATLINDRQVPISDMHRRAEEKQASDALFQGKIVWADGTKVEFNKKSTHDLDVSSEKWSGSGKACGHIADACKLIIDDGLVSGGEFDLWLEDKGLHALLANDDFKANADVNKGINRTNVGKPVEKTPGGTFHGQISIDSFVINLWTYNEKYEIPQGYNFANEGKKVGYIPSGCGLILPTDVNFARYYGAINNVNAQGTTGGGKLQLVKQEQLTYSYDEVRGGSAVTIAGVKSRPLYVPVDVDAFVTFKNLV